MSYLSDFPDVRKNEKIPLEFEGEISEYHRFFSLK